MEATDTPVARARGLQLPLAAADGAQIAIFVGCLAGHLAMAVTAFGASLLDAHGFRQTQTAITAASMAAGGPFFRYETPVLGAPFSLPFELPLYQWLSARLSTLGGLPLETAGRLVSEAFFLLTAAALFAALGALGIPRLRRLAFVSILLVSPVYLFWSQTFMIESTALCLCMAWLALLLAWIRRPDRALLACAALAGALGGMVKATTLAAFLVAGLCVLLLRRARPAAHAALAVAAAFVIPVAATAAWTTWADAVKRANVLGHRFTSGALREWTLGKPWSRFDLSLWSVQLDRAIPDSIGSSVLLAAGAAAVIATRRRRGELAVCVLGYLAGPLVFANLHFVHDYYVYANAIFLCVSVGFGVLALAEGGGKLAPALGIALLVATAGASLARYGSALYPRMGGDHAAFLRVAQAAAEATRADDVLIGFGLDWSPELPYYAGRRALLWSTGLFGDPEKSPLFDPALDALRGSHVGAVVSCGPIRRSLFERLRSRFALDAQPRFAGGGCLVFAAAPKG